MKLLIGIFSSDFAKIYLTIALLFQLSTSLSQSMNSNWKQDLNIDLQKFKSCENTADSGINPCNKFVGSMLKTVYKVNDFYSQTTGRYMLVSEIAKFLEENKQWKLLGHAYEQGALSQAQDYANAKKAAVAVYLDSENIGHVSLILPGELKLSGSWGFNVPNSASFFLNQPENSYIGKGLSYAFKRNMIKEVLLYARSY